MKCCLCFEYIRLQQRIELLFFCSSGQKVISILYIFSGLVVLALTTHLT